MTTPPRQSNREETRNRRSVAAKAFAVILRSDQIIQDPVELLTYERDAGLDRAVPDLVVLPHTAREIAEVVRIAAAASIPVVARGAGTGLVGGAVAEAGGIVMSLARMDAMTIDPSVPAALVEPGAVNLELDRRAGAVGLAYPPDPSSGRTSTIGGNVATNAGGPHCFKYGVTTNYVTGLEVVLADGRLVWLGGQALDCPEYDLVALLTGSEGTLGIVSRIRVRLVRQPPAVRTLMASFDSLHRGGEAVSAVIAAGLQPATLEMMDRTVIRIVEDFVHAGLPVDAEAILIVDVDGCEQSVEAQANEIGQMIQAYGARDIRVAASSEERERIWYARKSAAGAFARVAPAYFLVDVTVPRTMLAETLREVHGVCEAHDVRSGHVFHAGDGNLHPLIPFDPREPGLLDRVFSAGRDIVKIAVAKDGSITGEHGVGIEKRDYMREMYRNDELSAMLSVKRAFDPRGVLNPGKILPGTLPPVSPRPDVAAPRGVFAPASVEEAAAGLAALAKIGRSVRIHGSRREESKTGVVALSTDRLTGVLHCAPHDLYVTVGAGTSLLDIRRHLEPYRVQVALATPWQDATVGGVIAANVNAPQRLRYGGVRDQVLAVTAVLGDGRIVRAGRPVVKNVAGYDLARLFVGSHGTLGLIVDVTCRLVPVPRLQRSLVVPVSDPGHAVGWAASLRQRALVASAIVICDAGLVGASAVEHPYALVYTAEGMAEDVAMELSEAASRLASAGAVPGVEVDQLSGTDLWTNWVARSGAADVSLRIGLPVGALEAFVAAEEVRSLDTSPFIDAASGSVFAAVTASAPGVLDRIAAIRAMAVALDGYAVVLAMPDALEGTLDRWGYDSPALDLMRAVKAAWDPAGILNPGVFVV